MNYKRSTINNQQGFSVIEVILAAALFMIFSTGAMVVVLQGFSGNQLGAEETIANQFAAEGVEAIKSIKNQAFANLINTNATGVTRNAGVWALNGTQDILTSGKNYTRVIKIEDVFRDASGNIVGAGTLDTLSKKITATASWNASPTRNNSVVLTTYLTDWRRPLTPPRGGVLVYGNGGTTSDAMEYRILDANTGIWGSITPFPDFDTSALNKALRAIRVDASKTRNEKIALSRHFNGSQQFIYAHVFNGTTWVSTPLSSWSSTALLDVRNFDGAYLNNGDYLAVYSDNSTTPKYRRWNGSTWIGQANTTNVGGIPVYVVLKSRPGTNEALMAVFDQQSDTNTSYFNGASWSAAVEHATAAPTNTKEHIDFAWSPQNPSKGALVYTISGSDNTQNLRVCTAPCATAAGWSTSVNGPNAGGRLGAVDIAGRLGAEEFLSCQKNANNKIICFRNNTTPSWNQPGNNTLTNNTDNGLQRSYNISFEAVTGNQAIVVYSDSSSDPQVSLYDRVTDAFGALSPLPSLSNTLETVRLRPVFDSDDIMILMADGNRRLSTIVWDGSNDSVYTTPSGKAFTQQGINGSATTDFWYDFAWDGF